MAQETYHFLRVFKNNLATMIKNPVAKQLRTPKFKPKKVESKKKYNRKKEVVGYYYDGYNDKTETLYKEKK